MAKIDTMHNIIQFNITASGSECYQENQVIAKTRAKSKEYILARSYCYEVYNECNMYLNKIENFDIREEFFDNLRKFKEHTDLLIQNVEYITNTFDMIEIAEEKYFSMSIKIGDSRDQEVNMYIQINLETTEVQKKKDFLKLLDYLEKSESTGMLIDTGKDIIEIAGDVN